MTQTPDRPDTPRHPYDHTDDERPVEDVQTGEYL